MCREKIQWFLFHFCTTYEVQNDDKDNFKISSDHKHKFYATTPSSVSAGDTITITIAVYHIQQSVAIILHCYIAH